MVALGAEAGKDAGEQIPKEDEMTIQQILARNDAIMRAALDQAISFYYNREAQKVDAEEVIKTAKGFEKFLKGETDG